MAESSSKPDEPESGAHWPEGKVDPDLIKLKRKPMTVGVITAAGVVFLSIVFLLRLNGDRRFGSGDAPQAVSVQDVAAGKIDDDSYITVEAEPQHSHGVRASRTKAGLGFRVVPARGSNDKLWIVLGGDGWDPPSMGKYTGRLRRLDDLAFATAMFAYAEEHPRPLFATLASVRAGAATNQVQTVTGGTATLTDATKVAYDLTSNEKAIIVSAFNERLPNATAWSDALKAAGLTPGAPIAPPLGQTDQTRFEIAMPNALAEIPKKLEAANLWAARVEPITSHHTSTWGELKTKPPVDGTVDLVGLYVVTSIPDDAYALVLGEKPQDYWYVLPITVVVALILLVFAWALVRAVRRDVLG